MEGSFVKIASPINFDDAFLARLIIGGRIADLIYQNQINTNFLNSGEEPIQSPAPAIKRCNVDLNPIMIDAFLAQ
jgi:hypothetical protein